MVGHTHEVIDQLFSRLAVEIPKRNLCTLDGMCIHMYLYCSSWQWSSNTNDYFLISYSVDQLLNQASVVV